MVDYSAGDISSEEAAELIKAVEEAFGNEKYKYYSGVSYRHCLVVSEGTTDLGNMTPPHDISGRVVGEYLSTSENAKELIAMMKESYDLLKDHPVNKARKERGLRPGNSIWLWSPGKKPRLPDFTDKWGISGTVISAVDLIRGIGLCAGLEVLPVINKIDLPSARPAEVKAEVEDIIGIPAEDAPCISANSARLITLCPFVRPPPTPTKTGISETCRIACVITG